MDSKPIESLENLGELKRLYLQQTTAPLDGMWLCGFVPMAAHHGLYSEGELAGFYCVNGDGYLLQFMLHPRYEDRATEVFAAVAGGSGVQGAFSSTAEPRYLSLCLDRFSEFKVNALMYQRADRARQGAAEQMESGLPLQVVTSSQLSEAVTFAHATIGAPEEWLTDYYARLIGRGELYGLWADGKLAAAGESRGYDDVQTEYVDLGVIVGKASRGRGLATKILTQLANRSEAGGLKPICSTEAGNVAAQTAIRRAGFFAGNRIVQFDNGAEKE